MPAPKLAYALLTGSLFGQGAATLPDHWHVNIDAAFVQQSSFTGIGRDWWDTTNDNDGLVVRFDGLKETSGKRFIERELMLLMGAYMPVRANGALYLKRMTGVLSGAPYVAQLDDTNVESYGKLRHAMKDLMNQISIEWGYSAIAKQFTRKNLYIDASSISTHGESDLEVLKFRGLHGSRFTAEMLGNRTDSLRDRYAGPPLQIQVSVFFSQNALEVGDVVRLTLDQVRDYTGDDVSNIDRAFEIQGTHIDWDNGKLKLNLFGSSQKADGVIYETNTTALLDSFYISSGTNISTLPGFSLLGAVGHLTTDLIGVNALAGGADMTSPGSIWYYDGDLELDSGVTMEISDNVQLRVRGNFQVNGVIDGIGGGFSGVAHDGTSIVDIPGNPGGRGFTISPGVASYDTW